MSKVLYFLEDRIPAGLRELVTGYLDAAGHDYRLCFYSMTEQEIREHMAWAEIVLFAPGRYLPDDLFAAASHVKLMQLWSSGYDKFNIEGARRFNIPVANNGGANAISVAEHTILLLLAAARRLPTCHVRATKGMWAGNSHGMDSVMLYNKTLAIIGMGNIGRQVARRASAFGMRISYHDIRRLERSEEQDLGATYCELDPLLEQADFLTLHLHLTNKTRRIIGERELGLMKPGSIIVNVSRAQLIDTDALVPLLKNGKVLAAGFDVFEKEPTTGFETYLLLPNVVASPHTAGSTIDTYHMMMRNCMDNIARVLAGQPPRWVVN